MSLRATPNGTLLDVRVVPNAGRCALVREADGRLKVRLDAPPVEGKANERLVQFLAREVFGVPKSRVSVVRGEQGRSKTVCIDLPLEEALQSLAAAIAKMGSRGSKG